MGAPFPVVTVAVSREAYLLFLPDALMRIATAIAMQPFWGCGNRPLGERLPGHMRRRRG